MKILVTGADGFIGKNLLVKFSELTDVEVVKFTRQHTVDDLPEMVSGIEAIVHLAGVNRPQNCQEFATGNVGLTNDLCEALQQSKNTAPIIFASSIQSSLDNDYGNSKAEAERILWQHSEDTGARVYVFRLPNVFGKWCKPNYNSVVATFCSNTANNTPISINDPDAPLDLAYIDDVVEEFIRVVRQKPLVNASEPCEIPVIYHSTVGELAQLITSFRDSRDTLISAEVGVGLPRALYSTYVSYIPPESFSYSIPRYRDERGDFVEMLKTSSSGQFSFFTAHPGITRGGHYHHTKTEKFLVIKGQARFGFRNILTDETYELTASGSQPCIVESVPGWSHNITNVGDTEMVVMLWANEVFDRNRPDTITHPV